MTVKSNLSLIAIILFASLLASAHATSTNSSLTTYLSTYNISTATIATANITTAKLSGNSYDIVQFGSSTNYLVIQNISGSYSLVTNVSTITLLLTPLLSTGGSYPSSTELAQLNVSMQNARRYGYSNLTDCLTETGLSQNTCTLANDCFACKTVPVCNKVLNSVGGPNSPFGLGIMNFSSNYTKLNDSYNSYFSLLAKINQSNAGTTLGELTILNNNITSISAQIDMNPIFPPPQNANYQECNAGLSPNQQPFFCSAVGYCSSIPENVTALSNVQSELAGLTSNLPSSSGIASISENASVAAQTLMSNQLANKNGASYTQLISTITPKIDSIVNASDTLLLRYNNASLNASIQALQSEFTKIKSAGVNQSVNASSNTIQSLLSNSQKIYSNASASYNQIYNTAQTNSAALLADQLSYQQIPTQLAVSANKQQSINARLNAGVNSNDLSSIRSEQSDIAIESSLYVAPLTIGYMIKSLDGSFISSMLASSSATVPQKVISAPVYAAVESLIIGIIILAVLFVLVYINFIRKNKLKGNKRLQRTIMIAFAVVLLLVIIYIYSTYAYASNATNFLPFNYFLNTVKGSSSVYIALNGSAATNLSIGSCVSTLQGSLTKASKTVQIVKLENYSCVSGSNISVLGLDCYNNLLSSGKPVIFISQSQSSSIVYRGLYGTVLYASGNVTAGPSCALSTLFKNV
jgi:hypothetical protein